MARRLVRFVMVPVQSAAQQPACRGQQGCLCVLQQAYSTPHNHHIYRPIFEMMTRIAGRHRLTEARAITRGLAVLVRRFA